MINLNCNSNSISIEIKDNGCCITSEQSPNIFLPLVSYKQDGTGLGLPISKKIIKAHKGTISVISEDNYTSFIITLPVLFIFPKMEIKHLTFLMS